MSSVVIAHPGLQHSHQLAWALHERGLLQQFCSGVPVLDTNEKPPLLMPDAYVGKLKRVPIPRALRRHPPLFQALLRVGSRLPHGMAGDDFSHRVFHFYDWWYSQQLQRLRPKVVVAYENAAFHTFLAAKAIGARCVLDAASLHHSAGTRWQVDQPTKFRAEINRRKDIEVQLADLIITCSPLAKASYLEADVPAAKLRSVLLGSDLSAVCSTWQPHEGPIHYVFAGALRYLKAIDVILAVFRRLHDENQPVRISFIGGMAEAKWLGEIRRTPNAEYIPSLAQAELYEKLAQADCLLLPSRFDSFGMVVAEAMACGTPAVVSTRTGAKAIIEKFPGSGWIIEPEQDSLYKCLRSQVFNRAALNNARLLAREAAGHFTWQAYRQRIGDLFEGFLT